MTARSLSWLLAGAATMASPAAYANAPVEILISDAGARDSDGNALVEVRLLNGGTQPRIVPLPVRIEARLESDGTSSTVWLERTEDTPADTTIPPESFRRASYRFLDTSGPGLDGAGLSIPAWSARQITIALQPAATTQVAQAEPPMPATGTNIEIAAPPSDRSVGNRFLGNLSAYEPIYAVYGPGTDSEARIQISFKYQLFGTRSEEGLPRSWRDGLHFAYSQRMFWDLGAESSPFRNIDYQPELFYLTPPATLSSCAAPMTRIRWARTPRAARSKV